MKQQNKKNQPLWTEIGDRWFNDQNMQLNIVKTAAKYQLKGTPVFSFTRVEWSHPDHRHALMFLWYISGFPLTARIFMLAMLAALVL